jgi:hypothetical protein
MMLYVAAMKVTVCAVDQGYIDSVNSFAKPFLNVSKWNKTGMDVPDFVQ